MSVTFWPEYGMSVGIRAEFASEQYKVITEPSDSLVVTVVPYLMGEPGSPAATYEHLQSSPSTLWVVNHNFGRNPVLSVLDSAGREVVADVLHTSLNQSQVYFNQPITGKALAR
jgi:hypothetical protein